MTELEKAKLAAAGKAHKIGIAAAGAHGFMRYADFNPIHYEQAKRIVDELAELLWPGDASMKWKERDNVEK